MKNSNQFGKKVFSFGVRPVIPVCTTLYTIPSVLTRSNGTYVNAHRKTLREFHFYTLSAVISCQYRGLHVLRPVQAILFPKKLFDFLIRLS